jgi:hypothetical protein
VGALSAVIRDSGSEEKARRHRWWDEVGARRWWPVLTPLAGLAVAVSLLSPSMRHQWVLSLFRQPTRYTVLSFKNPSTLPTTTFKNRPLTFTFYVGNREGRPAHYRYVLSVTRHGSSYILGESMKTVAAGATWAVSATVRPECDGSPCRIEISLPGHSERIDFLLTSSA